MIPGFLILLRRVAPDVEIALRTTGGRVSGLLKPGMLIRSVIDHQLRDDTQSPRMCLAHKVLEIAQCAVGTIHVQVIGDVIAVVTQR